MNATNLPPSTESDRLLEQQVVRCLNQRNHLPHRVLKIEVDQGVVIVRGRLPSFFLRQVAIECIRRVPGVIRIDDEIHVGEGRERAPAPHCHPVS